MKDSEIELARKARRDYARAYRARNPERAKEIQQRYWARRAMREQAKATAAKKEADDGAKEND